MPENRDTPSTKENRRPACMRPCANTLAQEPAPGEDRARLRYGGKKLGRKTTNARESKKSDARNIRQPFGGVSHLYEVIEVRLARTKRLVEVNTNGFRLEPHTPVLVRVRRNILLATTSGYRFRRVADINSLPFIVRIASADDIEVDRQNVFIEKRAHSLATSYAIEHNLLMKVLSADLSHDHKNITINFASDVRVDFREMVAYLAAQLKLRIEMYQLGLRNGTGLICGMGTCGQLLCCGRFLGQFDPIAVRQLRAQGLATNPKRISGVCGRLYCCMSYEYVDYMREQRQLPKKGKSVFTRWGIGRVTDVDPLREDFAVTYENGETQRVNLHDCLPVTDDILQKIQSGALEFPIEPAKFYLNRDPDAACAMDSRMARISKPTMPHSRRRETSTVKGVHVASPLPSEEINTVAALRLRKKNPSARRRTNPKSGDSPKSASSPQRPEAPPKISPHSEHMARMPRTVKARHANLEQCDKEKRRPSGGRSRRRSLSFNHTPGGAPKDNGPQQS